MDMRAGAGRVDVEFSLALHHKTGKYFHGRDLIAAAAGRVHQQLFWRLGREAVPGGLAARVIGRLLVTEVDARVRSRTFDRLAPRLRRPRPVVHNDPFTILLHRLERRDIVLCHDVGPLTHPALFEAPVVAAYRKAYAEIASAGPHMVFVSRASQDAFHDLFPGVFASSRVIYPALRAEVIGGARTPIAGLAAPFLLSVGNVGDRKNQARAIRAFALSGLAKRGVQYVLCGGREPGHEAVAALAAATPGVRLYGFVSDAVLNWLYGAAAGFVLPSLLEGFGVPVAEAINRGLVPLVSADSVLQEVAGDGALLVDPLDPADIAQAMRAVIDMPPGEGARRRAMLSQSLTRFSPAAFEQAWRAVIEEAVTAI